LIVAGALVFVVAAVVVGREARRLDAVVPRAVYELNEAVEYVAERLPGDAQARLSHDDVRALLIAHLRLLQERGLARGVTEDLRQTPDLMVRMDETDVIGALIARVEADTDGDGRSDIQDEDVAAIVDGHFAYLDAIGAIGPPAEEG
jgi:hypothetical protein